MSYQGFWSVRAGLLLIFLASAVHAQIDPEKRRLIQIGYNQPLEGRAPIAGYGFFYYNKPNFLHTNLTLRAAIAPIYIDTELGIKGVFTDHTDVGLGLAGGGFADTYSEIRGGHYHRDETFTGHGGEVSVSVYHLFNPGWQVPLYGIARAAFHTSFYEADEDTARNFQVPEDFSHLRLRNGLRLGGREPTLNSPLAMELSLWYEALIREDSQRYGFNGDRLLQSDSHFFWTRASLKYTWPESEHAFDAGFTLGTSIDSDRLSAYRLGGVLPFVSEFPLSIPGYYYQELAAEQFALLNGEYSFPFTPNKNWRLNFFAASGWVEFLDEMGQHENWHSGVGAGITYASPSRAWFVSLVYGHGFSSLRKGEYGSNQVGILFQYDFEAPKKFRTTPYEPEVFPFRSRAGERLFK